MKRLLFCVLFSICFRVSYAQRDVQLEPQLQFLIAQGWVIQHQSMSFDSLSLYFSALAPSCTQYDLYISHLKDGKWQEPQALSEDINSSEDELWPSISSDESLIYFCRRIPHMSGVKSDNDLFYIYSAKRQGDIWEQIEPILISEGHDISPLLLADNQTLFFARKENPDKRDAYYTIYVSRRFGEHTWYLPQRLDSASKMSMYGPTIRTLTPKTLYLSQQTLEKGTWITTPARIAIAPAFRCLPFYTLTGQITNERTGAPVNGQILVYDAITAEHLFTCHADATSGKYRLALQPGHQYYLDYTASHHTHHYEQLSLMTLQNYPIDTLNVQLSDAFQIRFLTFDADRYLPIEPSQLEIHDAPTDLRVHPTVLRDTFACKEFALSLGEEYVFHFRKEAFADTTIRINTDRQMCFSHSEVDVLLRPAKSPVQFVVLNEKDEAVHSCKVIITNQLHDETIEAREMNQSYYAQLRRGETFEVGFHLTGYFYYDTLMAIPLTERTTIDTIRLRSIEQDAIMRLKNILFEYGSYQLDETSFAELDKVVALMRANPRLHIELSAHTDNRGTDAYNDRLSTLRGQAAADYIIRHGIDRARITAVGYGKRMPIVANDTDANRAINRRVEFRVTEL